MQTFWSAGKWASFVRDMVCIYVTDVTEIWGPVLGLASVEWRTLGPCGSAIIAGDGLGFASSESTIYSRPLFPVESI